MLHIEQSYVFEIAGALGIEVKILPPHRIPTTSCKEKLNLLQEDPSFKDWTLDRIVKALYFSRNGLPFIGVITPEFNKNIEPKDIFPVPLKMSRGRAENYRIDRSRVPNGMKWGTCAPFPLESSMGTEISDLIVISYSSIDDKLVDISVGGTDEKSFRTSIHLPYGAIYQILKRKFPNNVHLYTK